MDANNLNKINHKLEMDRLYFDSNKYMKELRISNEKLKGAVIDNNLGYFNSFIHDALDAGIINEDELNAITDYIDATEQYYNDLNDKYREYGSLFSEIRNYIYDGQSTKNDLDGMLEKIEKLEDFELMPPEFTQELEAISSKLPEKGRNLLNNSKNKVSAMKYTISYLESTVDMFDHSISEFNETGEYTGFDHIDDLKLYNETIIERRAYINEQNRKLESDNLSYDERMEIMKNIDDANHNLSGHLYAVSQVNDILENNGYKVFHNSAGVSGYIEINDNIITDNLLVTIAGFKVYDSSVIQEIADDCKLGSMPLPLSIN
ncbi:TPA: hypothetical protein ACS72K_001866 [Providencia alcalifaciens]